MFRPDMAKLRWLAIQSRRKTHWTRFLHLPSQPLPSTLKELFSANELRLCFGILHRSGILRSTKILQSGPRTLTKPCSFFHTSPDNQCSQKSAKPPPTDGKEGSSNDGDKKDDESDEEEKERKRKEKEDDDEIERRLFILKTIAMGVGMASLMAFFFGGRPKDDFDPAIIEAGPRQPRQPGQVRPPREAGGGMIDVSWNDFYNNMLMAGEVQQIIVYADAKVARVILRPNAIYKGERVASSSIRMNLENIPDLEDRIRALETQLGIPANEGVTITYRIPSAFVTALVPLLIIGVMIFVFRKLNKNTITSDLNPFSKMTKAKFTLVDPKIHRSKGVKFADVAGLKEAKIEVREFVDFLKNPAKYSELGAKPPKGALLTGPPGCGKTMLAKAVATESKVPFLSMNGSEFIEMLGGLGAARVRDLFAEARKRAPSIIFIDEIDAIGRKRTGGSANMGSGNEAENTLNQLLVEMDGITSKEGVVMLASTNRADVLDKALLRPGRFDRHIMIDLPNVVERKEILEQHMKGVKLDGDLTKYSERLATLTPGFSGADLANVINEAALHAARLKHKHVQAENLEYAIERVIAGPEKKTNVLSPAEKRIVAYHESGHALVGWMLKHTDALLKVTILPRTSQALGFAQYTPTDKKLYSPEELMDRMCMALGGRVAESLTFNRITTGAQNDLEKVTKMAYAQIKFFGFNQKVGLLSFESNSNGPKPFSRALQNTMDQEARLLIAESYRRTEAVLTEHKDLLKLMAETLLQKETLNYDDVVALIGPPPHGKKHLVSPVDFEVGLNEQAKLGAEVNGGTPPEV